MPTWSGTASLRPPATATSWRCNCRCRRCASPAAIEVRMGLVFFRKISRVGISYAWPGMLPGQWVFDRPAHLIFSNLKPRRLVEVLPSVTYGVTQARETANRWQAADGDPHFGVNGKFGITSGITLDGTVNPDFSQVESDAFQVEVNQRFPVFYSEKRPFFMEGMGLFNIAGSGNNMRTAVHTRRIVDPIWGSKITGTAGKTTFGVLNSLDDQSGGHRRSRRLVHRSQQALHDRPRHLRAPAFRLHRRHRHAHRTRRPQQPGGGRRRVDQAIIRAAGVGGRSWLPAPALMQSTRMAMPCRRPTATTRVASR